MAKRPPPNLLEEKALWSQGYENVVGLDEVGRGAWAGPLTVGAAVVPKDRRIYRVRDSKQLSETKREQIFDRVAEWTVAWSVGHASNLECDRLGMSAAQKLAARRAIAGLGITPDAVILDGKWDFLGHSVTRLIVKADAKCLSVSAASILAKVTRDRIMRAESENFPAYSFESNKGYPCAKQIAAINGYGSTVFHRRSWAFMDNIVWNYDRRQDPYLDRDQMTLFGG